MKDVEKKRSAIFKKSSPNPDGEKNTQSQVCDIRENVVVHDVLILEFIEFIPSVFSIYSET